MAYLIGQDTANWIREQRRKGNLVATPRTGHILQRDMASHAVSVCKITGGNSLNGYTATAYQSMMDLRADSGGRSVTVYPVEIGLDADLPEGTIVLCHTMVCRVTGGSETEGQ